MYPQCDRGENRALFRNPTDSNIAILDNSRYNPGWFNNSERRPVHDDDAIARNTDQA
jgi:hypothetical protein